MVQGRGAGMDSDRLAGELRKTAGDLGAGRLRHGDYSVGAAKCDRHQQPLGQEAAPAHRFGMRHPDEVVDGHHGRQRLRQAEGKAVRRAPEHVEPVPGGLAGQGGHRPEHPSHPAGKGAMAVRRTLQSGRNGGRLGPVEEQVVAGRDQRLARFMDIAADAGALHRQRAGVDADPEAGRGAGQRRRAPSVGHGATRRRAGRRAAAGRAVRPRKQGRRNARADCARLAR